MGFSPISSKLSLHTHTHTHHRTDMIVHTTAFITSVVKHWLEIGLTEVIICIQWDSAYKKELFFYCQAVDPQIAAVICKMILPSTVSSQVNVSNARLNKAFQLNCTSFQHLKKNHHKNIYTTIYNKLSLAILIFKESKKK